MMKDKFANYVVQKAVEVAPQPIRDQLITKIRENPDPNNYCKNILMYKNNVSYACI